MKKGLIYFLLWIPFLGFSQVEEESEETSAIEIVEVVENKIDTIDYLNLKNPMRASLYSAVVPGLGQFYNKKYWKVPLVWGLIGTGVGFVVHYNNQYKEYRGYYLDKLYGYELENPTLNSMDIRQLAIIQDDRKRNRDYAIAITALAYILNIVDATVDAHLYGIKKDPDLSFDPVLIQNNQTQNLALGLGFSLKF